MGLTVEISFDIQKNVNVITTQNYLKYIAEKNNCIDNYFIFEIEGENTYISRNDCIQILEFNLDINIIKYIKEIEKCKFVKIDCIYLENKVITKTVLRIPISKINYIVIKQSFLEKLLDIGTIFIETSDKSSYIKIRGISSISEKNMLIMEKIKSDL